LDLPPGAGPQRIRDRLAGHHLLVTGATGFLARAFVEKVLRSVDSLAGLTLLIRPRSDGTSAQERALRDVLASSAFDRLRAALGDGFTELCRRKVHVVSGDLTREHFGLPRDEYQALTRRVTAVVNSAATVTFDERLDLALELNTFGPQRLLQFARDAGNLPFLHVSTCYVCGQRHGTVVEDFSAPEAARESLPRDPAAGEFDFDTLLEDMRAETLETRHRYGADSEMCRQELIEAGMRRARRYGWNDTYTFTKWLGEQLLRRNRGQVPLVVFRPAIIEGSHAEPTPGWIDGLRMADPLFVAYGKGKLNEFPANREAVIDFIPVDFVANAMIATLPIGAGRRGDLAVYHCASSARHPLRMGEMIAHVQEAFRKRPMNDERGRPLELKPVITFRQDAFLARWTRRRRRLIRLRDLLQALGMKGKRLRRLASTLRQIDQLIYFARIYAPYTHLDCRFADDGLQAVPLHPDDAEEFPFDCRRLDWHDYLVDRHLPGLRSYVLGTGAEPTVRLREADRETAARTTAEDALAGTNLFEVFRRAAERYRDKPALQVRRNGRWLRYTYEEALHATGTIMRRFQERGLRPGDRITICAESCPEWGLTYLAAMRAGLTVVALDPQLPPADVWAAVRFVEAKLLCAGRTTHAALVAADTAAADRAVLLTEPFIPPPAASRDVLPEPVPLSGDEVASILFTSGTTVSPKAVQLTHRNFIANARALVQVQPLYSSDEFLSVLPMYHAFEFTGGFFVPLSGGATITYVEQLKGPEIVSAMQATGTTVMMVVPRLLQVFHSAIEHKVLSGGRLTRAGFRLARLLARLGGRRLRRLLFGRVHRQFGGRLRLFFSGGAQLAPELFDAFGRMGFMVCEGYGLTETAPVLTVNPPDDARRGSVGRPLPNVELEIRNPNLEGIGEVWAHGPNITRGYLHNAEATHEVLHGGWFRTGDLGRFDEDGYLYITGRCKDLIVTSAGKNVYPDEVEMRYRDLPYVQELCVLAMPAADGVGDAVHAVVVIDPAAAGPLDRSYVEREIRLAAETVGQGLPSHQRITAFHFWERELPKTSTLKTKRGLVREALLAEGLRQAERVEPARPAAIEAPGPAAPRPEAYRPDAPGVVAIRAIVAKHARRAPEDIAPSHHLSLDLGIDSIGKVDLISEIEGRFKFKIADDLAAKTCRVSDLLQLAGWREPAREVVRDPSAWQRRLAMGSERFQLDGETPVPLKPLRWTTRGAAAVFMKTYVRVRARGREQVPATGPFILAANHSSHLDAPAVLTAVGGRRRVWIAGAEDYFFNTRLKRLVFGRLLDTIPFDRRADGLQGLRRCSQALARGDGLLLFPEGTRSTTGMLQPFKIGVAVLAVEYGVPIVPVYIDGAYDLWPKGRGFSRPGLVRVTFAEPIVPPQIEPSVNRYAAFQTLIDRVRATVVALAHEMPRR